MDASTRDAWARCRALCGSAMAQAQQLAAGQLPAVAVPAAAAAPAAYRVADPQPDAPAASLADRRLAAAPAAHGGSPSARRPTPIAAGLTDRECARLAALSESAVSALARLLSHLRDDSPPNNAH